MYNKPGIAGTGSTSEVKMSNRNELTRGTVETVILKLLSEKAMYGYEMMKLVNQRTAGYFEWREGSLYPCLHRLEADGMIASFARECGGKPRKYYTLTKKGTAAAEERVSEAREFCRAFSLLLGTAEA